MAATTSITHAVQPESAFVIEREDNLELSVDRCLKGLGISLLCELDVLVFVYRHGISLANAEQIAFLVGCESETVDLALKQLESERMIECSRYCRGKCLLRFLAPTDPERKRCLRQLFSLLETRAGRLLAVNHLKLDRPGSRSEKRLCKGQ